MATWIKVGKDLNALLGEAAKVDPYIAQALEGTGPFEDATHFTHVVADICWNPAFDSHGRWIDQSVEISPRYAAWARKGDQIEVEGRIVYGSKEPGFRLMWREEVEKLPEGPREWGPKPPAIIYTLMLTVAKEKSRPAVKKVAEGLGWELISG